MDRRVAVVSGVVVLVGADGIESLGTLVQVADDAGLVEFTECRENGVCVPKVRTTDNLQAPMPASSSAGSTRSLIVRPSPKRKCIWPRDLPRLRKRSGQVMPSGFFFWPRCSIE